MIESYQKLRPDASIERAYDSSYYIEYRCPICHRIINHTNNSFCEKCRVLFDWDKKAYIKVINTIEWK